MNSISLLPQAGRDAGLRMVLAFVLGSLWMMSASAANRVETLASPDGQIQISIELPNSRSNNTPRWSAAFRGTLLLADCQAGLRTADAGELLAGARLVRERRRSVNARVPVLFGKTAQANDRYREARFTL